MRVEQKVEKTITITLTEDEAVGVCHALGGYSTGTFITSLKSCTLSNIKSVDPWVQNAARYNVFEELNEVLGQ